MKRRNGPFYVLAVLLISCGHHNRNTSISFKDKNNYFEMNAHYNKSRTKAVEHFMNEKIGRKNNVSFLNTRANASFTLDDGTKFHLEKSPGFLNIELDKRENSEQSYYAVKEMCEDLKEVMLR